MGAGNEGDVPVRQGGALLGYYVHGARYVPHWADEPVRSSWVELGELERVARFAREAFRFAWDDEKRTCSVEPVVASARIEAFRASSGLARTLVEGIERVRDLAGRRDDGFYLPTEAARRVLALRSPASGEATRFLASGCPTPRLLSTEPDGGTRRFGALRKPAEHDRSVLSRFEPFGSAFASSGALDARGRTQVLVGASADSLGFHSDGHHEAVLWSVAVGAKEEPPVRVASGKTHPQLVDGCAFGRELTRLGDLDGDGAPEYAIARMRDQDAPWGEERAQPGEASIAVVSIDDGELVWRSTLPASLFDASGPDRGHSFATALAGVGDVDGDGVPDLAIGDPHEHTDAPYGGAVGLAFLRADGAVKRVARLALGTPGPRAGGELGARLAGLGDVDGNGAPDLLVAGADELRVLFLELDGSVKRVKRSSIDALVPGCNVIRDVATDTSLAGSRADRVLVSGLFGRRRPHDSRVHVLSVEPDGTLSAR